MPRLKAAKRSPALPADADGRCLTVLQLTPALNDGGAELSAVEMAGYLHRHGHRALVASSGGKRLNDLIKNGGMFFSLPLASKNPLRWIWNGWRLRCLIIEQRVQLVHARSRAPAWSGWLAARWAGVPFVATFHGTYSLGWFGLKRFYNSVMLRGPLVIANSQFIKGHLVENYGVAPQRVVVAARGIDPAQYDVGLFNQKQRVTMRAAWGCGEDEVVLVMVGRLT
ncbi:MAG: glycosyl transferase, partial [Proteobacteria bacterium]|nr:glycosyl transferase [Pseudomonadota bacterium]